MNAEASTEIIGDPADLDGDNLPDQWERDAGLDPLSSVGVDGAEGDPDAAGVSNADEPRT